MSQFVFVLCTIAHCLTYSEESFYLCSIFLLYILLLPSEILVNWKFGVVLFWFILLAFFSPLNCYLITLHSENFQIAPIT